MKKICLFAAIAGATLVSASPPAGNRAMAGASGGYPPCSRTVTDRCIQLYERGVRTRANLARNEALGPGRTALALGGPHEPVPSQHRTTRGAYPRCSATVRDSCIQGEARRAGRGYRYASRVHRAGERG